MYSINIYIPVYIYIYIYTRVCARMHKYAMLELECICTTYTRI